jgi:hypothetical protein
MTRKKFSLNILSDLENLEIFSWDPFSTQEERQVDVFWVVTPRSLVVGYRRFGTPWYLHVQGEEWDGMVFGYVGILPQHYKASNLRTHGLESSSPWKPQVLHSISFCVCMYSSLLINVMECLLLKRLLLNVAVLIAGSNLAKALSLTSVCPPTLGSKNPRPRLRVITVPSLTLKTQ